MSVGFVECRSEGVQPCAGESMICKGLEDGHILLIFLLRMCPNLQSVSNDHEETKPKFTTPFLQTNEMCSCVPGVL